MAHPRIVIVGGGFGGLAAAKALRKAPAEVVLIDRTNHHVFQPLLYQVATSVLSPNQIGFPIRGILKNQKHTTVIMGEVTGVDKDNKRVFVRGVDRLDVPLTYDYLILATGATHSYFGRNEFEKFAPGLKSLAGRGVCWRREARSGSVHGRFSGSVGSTGAERDSNGTGLEVEAELVPSHHRGPHDSTGCSTRDVEARGLKGHRNQREPRRFCLSTGYSRGSH
jgi:flavin-dependent dehydrogenase